MLTAQSRQKSYADVRRRKLEFAVGDEVLLKGIVCFGIKGKVSPKYIGPYLITARVGSLAYRLQLPEKLHRNWSQQCEPSTQIFLRPVCSMWYMFHLSFFGYVVEAAEFEDEFFLGGECNTKKKII
jgi:hypothetical protein